MCTDEYKALLEGLAAAATTVQEGGATVELRDAADRIHGKLDPRTAAACAAKRADFAAPGTMDEELAANYDRLLGPPQPEGYDELSLIRYTFGWRSRDLSRGIGTTRHVLYAHGRPFGLYEYRGENVRPGAPCLVFIHGGAFVAGDIETVENQCKLLAEMSGGVVFSVDYPLAPEYPFPWGLDACRAAVDWVHSNAAALGISEDKIGVAGDSAGGNLALVLSLLDRDAGSKKIACQCLVYPALAVVPGKGDAFYKWSADKYDNAGNDPMVDAQTREVGEVLRQAGGWYVPAGADRDDWRLNPVLAPCEGLCKTLLLYAEYDYLRVDCDAYAGMLAKAGVDYKAIRYGGITHGTFDRLGYAPQVEDMLREMAKVMESL